MLQGNSVSSCEGDIKGRLGQHYHSLEKLGVEIPVLKPSVTPLATLAKAGSKTTRHWSWTPPSTEDSTKVGLEPCKVKARLKGLRPTRTLRNRAEGAEGRSLKMGCQTAQHQPEQAMKIFGVPGFNYPLHNNNLYLKAKEAKDDLHVFL